MARKADTSGMSAELKAVVEEAAEKALAALYGERGRPAVGTLFSQIEDCGVDIGDAVSRAIMEKGVARQIVDTPPVTCCCGQALEERDPEPHPLATRRGEIHWMEPTGYCRKCRKSFFPSVEGLGD